MISEPIYFVENTFLRDILDGPIVEALEEAGSELEIHLELLKRKGTYDLYVTWRNNMEGCRKYNKVAYAGPNGNRYDEIYQILTEINTSRSRFKEIIIIPSAKNEMDLPTAWKFYIK